jgi:serine protease inhibitor
MSGAIPSLSAAMSGAPLAQVCAAGGSGFIAAPAMSSLGSRLFVEAARTSAAANVFLSPLSIYLALALALNAARPGSQTQAEILRALCAAEQAGTPAYAALVPGGGMPPPDAGAAEAVLNEGLSALSRSIAAAPLFVAPPPAASRPPRAPASPGASASAAAEAVGGSSNPSKPAAADPAPAPPGATPELLLANSLWTQKSSSPDAFNISSDYAQRMKQLYDATAQQGDSADVNRWAAQATKGLVQQAVAPGTPFDLLLANAVYFKGQWERAFDKANTDAQGDFSALVRNGSSVAFSPKKTPMMAATVKAADDRAAIRRGQRTPLVMFSPSFVAARLPYKGGKQSAVVVLPRDKSPGGLQALLENGGGMAGQGMPFDWRRDLGLSGPVPETWLQAVGNATGKSEDELRRLSGPYAMRVMKPPVMQAGGGGAGGAGARPASVSAMPTLPADSPWLPSSTRSSGGLVLRMPKFRAETKLLSLKPLLSKETASGGLGVRSAFDPRSADFSRAAAGGEENAEARLAVDDVIHSAVVIVDEEGTEAAAVTAVVMMRSALPMTPEDPPIEVILDRPFLFAVVDDASGTPLFTGAVVDPVWSEPAARSSSPSGKSG